MIFKVRPYQPADLAGLRAIYGEDEFARPRLLRRYPRYSTYLADEVTYYFTTYEPESIFMPLLSIRWGWLSIVN